MRSPVSRVTAAAVFLLAITGVFFWLHAGGATVSFAEVVERFLKVKSYKLKVTHQVGSEIRLSYDEMWTAPGHSRREFKNKNGVIDRVSIEDGNSERRKNTELSLEEKVAHLMEYANWGKGETFFDEAHRLMLNARDKKLEATPLGEKFINGRKAVGYRLNLKKYDTQQDIWADVETLLPIRIEITTTLPGDNPKTPQTDSNEKTSEERVAKSIWSNIQYNLNLDEALFSLDPPSGYKVVKHKTVVLPKREKQPDAESKEPVPMNSGTMVGQGEIEEEYVAPKKDSKTETKEPAPFNSGSWAPMGEVENEGDAKAKK